MYQMYRMNEFDFVICLHLQNVLNILWIHLFVIRANMSNDSKSQLNTRFVNTDTYTYYEFFVAMMTSMTIDAHKTEQSGYEYGYDVVITLGGLRRSWFFFFKFIPTTR